MIKAIVSYRAYYSTIKSELMDAEPAELYRRELVSEGRQNVQVTSYDLGESPQIARKALSLYKKVVTAQNAVSRAEGRNTGRLQSMAEIKARATLSTRTDEYRAFCDANNLPVIW